MDAAGPCRVARSFWQRLQGIKRCGPDESLLIPHCRCVHSIGFRRKLHVYFLDHEYRLLSSRALGPWRVAADWRASHVLESYRSLRAPVTSRPDGLSLVESLVALPLLIFFALVIVQIGLLWHSKFAITHAATVAARQASVHHGSDSAIRDGLVVGLTPLVAKSSHFSAWAGEMFRSQSEIAFGIAAGWLRWEVLSPTRQSFTDWARAADPVLSPGASAGEMEIPSEHLPAIALRKMPSSGIAGYVEGLPIGHASGQTLLEANNLKLNVRVGVPLQMPLAGPLLAKALGLWSGCGWLSSAQPQRIGLANFGKGVTATMLSSSIECQSLGARDLQGRWKPRWPIEASSVIHMQSNARRSVMVLRDRQQKTR